MKKKNKLTINTLAMGNLKQRRKQYTILIIGIILAMVFSSGVTFFVSCLQSSIEETKHRLYGTQHEIYLNATDIDFESSELSEFVREYSFAHTIGFAYHSEEKKDVGTAVSWLEDKAEEMYYPFLYEGRMPEKEGEAVIEREAIMTLGLGDKKLGDKITLTMKIPDGKGFSNKTEERTYTIVGIMCNKKSAICEWNSNERAELLPSVFVNKGEEAAVGGKELLVAFVNLYLYDKDISKPDTFSNEAFDRYYKSTENLLRETTYYHEGYGYGTSGTHIWSTMLYSIAFAAMLTLVSCLTIVNSFSNNLRERKKQIGMLRAVGATKRQIISIYAREAFIISLISAPVSILISYFGVKLIIKLMGDDLVFLPEVWILFVGALLGVIVVMLAALIPLIPISKSSPMQAIRNVEYMRRLRKKKIRSQKSFNVSSLLAKRNIMLSRSRQLVVSILLALTVIGSCYSFSGLSHEASQVNTIKYQYHISDNAGYDKTLADCTLDFSGFSNNDVADLVTSGYFDEVIVTKRANINILKDSFNDYELLMLLGDNSGYSIYKEVDEGLTKENYKEKCTAEVYEDYTEALESYNYSSLVLPSTLLSINEEYFQFFEDKVIEGEINLDKLNSGEEIILVAPEKIAIGLNKIDLEQGYTYLDSDYFSETDPMREYIDVFEIQECTYKVGYELYLSNVNVSQKDETNFVRTDRKVKIGAIVHTTYDDGIEFDMPYVTNLGILTTNSASFIFAPETDYDDIQLSVKDINDEKNMIIAPYLEKLTLSVTDGSFRNDYETDRDSQKDMKILFFGLYCLVSIFLIICGSVINNALTARIREGKREIGTLRAVGADLKVLSSSYIRQLLVIFGWGYGMGFGIYIIGYLLYIAIRKSMEWNKVIFELRLVETFVLCSILFVICAVNLVLKIRKEMKHSIVENIREL